MGQFILKIIEAIIIDIVVKRVEKAIEGIDKKQISNTRLCYQHKILLERKEQLEIDLQTTHLFH